ncbi:MAG TPA: methylated-DNA--[protein]-cysteine S-methyltransferase [Solirubrobacteraceae bacterium]|nr:methylated-DNA--[protein]-cysteine S-methyltransferase [Solirubrobacteraceae bacterium]
MSVGLEQRTALYTTMASPVGVLRIVGDERCLWSVSMDGQRWAPPQGECWRAASEPFEPTCRQLEEYFEGTRRDFDLPLRMVGTPFQVRVWEALAEIPFGQTRSYGELARAVGSPGASRAVGLANGRNPFAIVLPCHRVIGADGRLVGYGGGLQRKAWLLEHERDAGGSR